LAPQVCRWDVSIKISNFASEKVAHSTKACTLLSIIVGSLSRTVRIKPLPERQIQPRQIQRRFLTPISPASHNMAPFTKRQARWALCPLLVSTASAATLTVSHGAHWARENEDFTLGIINDLNDDGLNSWEQHFDGVLSTWSRSNHITLKEIKGSSNAKGREECTPKEGFVRVCNADYGLKNWAGRAEWAFYKESGHDHHMFQCIVMLNDNKSAKNLEEKLLCHELGHCLGLGHASTNGASDGTCMDYASAGANAAKSMQPSSHDYQLLDKLYSHSDKENTYEVVEKTETPQNPTTPEQTNPAPENGVDKCADLSKKECKNQDDCSWYKDEKICQPVDPVLPPPPPARPVEPAPEPPQAPEPPKELEEKCNAVTDKKVCKNRGDCVWDKDNKVCRSDNVPEPDLPDIPVPIWRDEICSNLDKDACKDQKKTCKWKKDVCQDKRRLLEEECDYDPEDFDVPAQATLVDCDEDSIMFELDEGDKIRVFDIILSDHARRRRLRHLRGEGP